MYITEIVVGGAVGAVLAVFIYLAVEIIYRYLDIFI